jgi:hypothetical protein
MKELKMKITKAELEKYEAVRASGVTNMNDFGFVCYATGLERDKVLEIMRRWDELKELYKD